MTAIEERYAKATRSSHLEVTEHDGDVDLIIAAGMAETLGVLLARLKAEWDVAHGNVGQYHRAQAEWVRLARESAAKSRDCAQTAERAKAQMAKAEPQELAELAKLIAEQERLAKASIADSERFSGEAFREASTARWEILAELSSLGPAKQALYNLAMRQAPKKAVDSTEAEIAALVGRVLDVWLDRLCLPCDGRGTTGGYGTPKIICSKCGGSGSRRNSRLSPATGEHVFGLWLLGVMDAKCADALKKISSKTRR